MIAADYDSNGTPRQPEMPGHRRSATPGLDLDNEPSFDVRLRRRGLVNRSVFESVHDDLDGNASLRDREFARKRTDHRTRQIECRCYFFAPGAFVVVQMIEQPNANRERAVFLCDMRVHAGEVIVGGVLRKIHGGTRSCVFPSVRF